MGRRSFQSSRQSGSLVSETRIRFRTDHAFAADDAARRERGEEMEWHRTKRELARTPPARPGDTWRLRWALSAGEKGAGPIAGYAICCPKCLRVHHWTTALNCPSGSCPHRGKSSCWTWTGSAEEGTLNASPSLHCVTEWNGKPTGGCGWHGFLTAGVLRG